MSRWPHEKPSFHPSHSLKDPPYTWWHPPQRSERSLCSSSIGHHYCTWIYIPRAPFHMGQRGVRAYFISVCSLRWTIFKAREKSASGIGWLGFGFHAEGVPLMEWKIVNLDVLWIMDVKGSSVYGKRLMYFCRDVKYYLEVIVKTERYRLIDSVR